MTITPASTLPQQPSFRQTNLQSDRMALRNHRIICKIVAVGIRQQQRRK